MITTFRKSSWACVALLLVTLTAACKTTPPVRASFPDITFTHEQPIRLDVARIEVVNEYVPPLNPPNVEHLFPVSIAAAVERWGRDRLQAVGADGVVRIIIRDASVREIDLRRTGGVRGAFTTDQAQRYDGRVEVLVEVSSPRGQRSGSTSAMAQRSQTVPENITLNERDRVYFNLADILLKDIDRELERNISQYLPLFIR